MIAIGYWIETLSGSPFPAPQECVGELPEKVRIQVCDYLDSGRLHEQYRGLSWCRFLCDADPSTMGSREFTDGIWLWPEGLSHYIRHHSVILPDEFIQWVTRASMNHPPTTSERLDFDFWIEWGRRRQNAPLRRQLRRARREQRRSALKDLRELKGQGVLASSKETTCLWDGCRHQAAAGKAFCAYHQVSPQNKREQLNGVYTGHRYLTSFLLGFAEKG